MARRPARNHWSVGRLIILRRLGAVGLALALVGATADAATPSITPVGEPIPAFEPMDDTGWAVAASADGSRIAVSSPTTRDLDRSCGDAVGIGRVRVFDWTSTGWTQVGSTIEGHRAQCEGFGYSVALSANGSRLAIGAQGGSAGEAPKGFVEVFELEGADWIQLGDEVAPAARHDDQGRIVALSADGSRLAVGIEEMRSFVRLFDWDGTTWNQIGGDISPGYSPVRAIALSTDGRRVVVGVPGAYPTCGLPELCGPAPSFVRAYDLVGGMWTQIGATIEGGFTEEPGLDPPGDNFGFAVSLSADGNRLAASSPGHFVRVLEWVGGDWSPVGPDVRFAREPDPEDPSQFVQPASRFGWSLALSSGGDRLAVGVPEWGCDQLCGVVDVFAWDGSSWAYVDGVGGGQESFFGQSVALAADGARLVVGASGGAAPGYVRVYDISQVPVAGTLPETGAHSGAWTSLVAVGLLALGAVLALVGRRPRSIVPSDLDAVSDTPATSP